MKSNIRQWLWLPLLLGSACAEQQEVIENSQPVNVVFKTQPLPETKSGSGDDVAILVFKKDNEGSFLKVNNPKETEWNLQEGSFQKSIVLPVGTYRFLSAKGFGKEGTASFVEEAVGNSPNPTSYGKDYYFAHPQTTQGSDRVLENCTTPLMADVNEDSENASQTEYDLSSLHQLSISRRVTNLQGLLCFIVRRATKQEDGEYKPLDSADAAKENALKKIDRIELSIEGASSRCYLFDKGLKFTTPLSYSCSLEKRAGDYQFGEFVSESFIAKFNSDVEMDEASYKQLEGSAYCEGPLLFPAPDGGKITVDIRIVYIETLKPKTFTREIELKRNQVQLFTLWLLNEDLNVSVDTDTELELKKLQFSDKVSGDDGFWN